MSERRQITRYAWLSIGTAVATITLKMGAYWLTGSVGLLSDALESTTNLAAAIVALAALMVAAQPPDDEHAYGHNKAEYFASGVEGTLILAAAGVVAYSAINRLFHPQPLEQVGIGLLMTLLASLLNLVAARVLLQAGRHYRSITLEADARHLMTDVWTSLGVVIGVGAVVVTGWQVLDALAALGVAVHILFAGSQLIRRSVAGLMDVSLPPEEIEQIETILQRILPAEAQYHALRTRQAGPQRFVSVHIQVPGLWSVQQGHTLLEEVEREIRRALPLTAILTHLEPIEDPVSWQDIPLNRK